MSERYGQITKSERAMLEVMRTFRVMEKAQLSMILRMHWMNRNLTENYLKSNFLEKDLFLHLKTFLKTVCRLRKQSG